MNKRSWLIFVGLLTIFSLLIVACSQDAQTVKEEQSESKTSPSSPKEGEAKEPKYGGTYTMAAASDADTLDPHRGITLNTHGVAGLVYNKLVTYKTGPDVEYTDYNIIPDLAESWESSEDGKMYTFHLREAYWHDIPPVNGRQLVAEDVVATMERIINLPGHQAGLLSEVEKIEAKDDKTVVFTLKQPFAPFLNFMANHFMWILPKEAVEGEIDLATTAIGTGPFMLEKWNRNVEKIFVRNPNYYEEGKPYLDEVHQLIIPDQGARIAAFRTGQADSVGAISPEELETIVKSNSDTVTRESILPTQITTFMNLKSEPFGDIRAIKRIFGDGEISGPVNPSLGDWALPLEEREALQPYDPEKAKQLLAEAGYPDGFNTKILTTDGFGEQVVRMAQWVAEDLRAIGIHAEIEMVDISTFISERLLKQNFDMGVMFNHYYQEPDEWLYTPLRTGAFMNNFGLSDPKLDQMLDEQRLILDEKQRKEKIYEIQRYVLENVVVSVTVTPYMNTPLQPYVKNWEPHASYGFGYMKDVWLDK